MQIGQLVLIINTKTGQRQTAKIKTITPCFVTVRLLPPSSSLVKFNLKTRKGTGINDYYIIANC